MIAAKPILFSSAMIRALLEGRKTQTRRVLGRLRRFGAVREFGPSDTAGYDWHFRDKEARWHDLRHAELLKYLPYAVGDLLWVREAWNPVHSADPSRGARYRADVGRDQMVWKPSIHMPRWASRLTLAVTGVRVERLQEISEADVVAEGLIKLKATGRYVVAKGDQYLGAASFDPRAVYSWLWDSINGAGEWARNPCVVALTFEVIAENVDRVLERRQAA